MTPLNQRGRSEGHIYILRGKIRRTHIYTMGEDQTDTYIYRKIEPHYSTKTDGEGQTDIYIYIYIYIL
jgi:hypothetical protein